MQHRIQYRIIYKTMIAIGMFGFVVTCMTTVIADNYTLPLLPRTISPMMIKQGFAEIVVAEQTNPWLLPETPDKYLDYQQQRRYPGQRNQSNKKHSAGEGYPYRSNIMQQGRFVTPGVLEALKQQQIQTQRVPDKVPERNRSDPFKQSMSPQLESGMPAYGYGGGAPSYGTGFANPLYDTPVTSPWGNPPDVIFRDESFPDSASDPFSWLPDEAVGGIPPIHTPSFGNYNYGKQYFGEPDNTEAGGGGIMSPSGQAEDNVFNPFTFIPNRNLH